MTTQKSNVFTVKASEVEQGQCFRKKGGSFVYLRISDSSSKFHKLDPAFIYGVCYNGNMAHIAMDKEVILMPMEAMTDNAQDEMDWNKTFTNPTTTEKDYDDDRNDNYED